MPRCWHYIIPDSANILGCRDVGITLSLVPTFLDAAVLALSLIVPTCLDAARCWHYIIPDSANILGCRDVGITLSLIVPTFLDAWMPRDVGITLSLIVPTFLDAAMLALHYP